MYIKEMMKGSWMQEYESSYLIQQAVTLARLRSDPAHPCMLQARTCMLQARTHTPIACNGYIVLSSSLSVACVGCVTGVNAGVLQLIAHGMWLQWNMAVVCGGERCVRK